MADKWNNITWKTENVVREVTLWSNSERYGQGEQNDRDSWGTVADSHSGRTQNSIVITWKFSIKKNKKKNQHVSFSVDLVILSQGQGQYNMAEFNDIDKHGKC